MQSEGGQFTVRGLFALVAGCAVLAAILRFSTMSVSALAAGFALGTVVALLFVAFVTALDAIERRAQARLAKKLNSEALPAIVSPPTPPSA